MRRATLVLWAPLALQPPISGDKVNEFERIRVLSRSFVVYAFVLISMTELPKARIHKKNWFKDTDAAVIVLPMVNVYGARMLSIFLAALVVAVATLVLKATRGVDGVVSRASIPTLPLVLVSKLAGIKLIYSAPGDPFGYKDMLSVMQNRYFANLIKMADYMALRNANYVGVATDSAAKDLSGFIDGEKIVILPFPISDAYFDFRSGVRGRRDNLNLLYYGSVTDRYDFSQLILGLQDMARETKISLAIYASPEGIARLRRYASLPFVHLRSQISDDLLREEIRRATAVVVPYSDRIGRILSLKSVQAMALGVPVIVSNPRDSIFRDGETCFVVSENSPEGWKAAIRQATMPENRARVVRGARTAAEAFRPEQNSIVISHLIK